MVQAKRIRLSQSLLLFLGMLMLGFSQCCSALADIDLVSEKRQQVFYETTKDLTPEEAISNLSQFQPTGRISDMATGYQWQWIPIDTELNQKVVLRVVTWSAQQADVFWRTVDGSWRQSLVFKTDSVHEKLGHDHIWRQPDTMPAQSGLLVRLSHPYTSRCCRIMGEKDYENMQQQHHLLYGVLLGIVAAMLLYNLALYRALYFRFHRIYLLYSFALLSLILISSGWVSYWLPLANGIGWKLLDFTALALVVAALFMFVASFLDGRHIPGFFLRCYRWIAWLVILLALLPILSAGTFLRFSVNAYNWIAVLGLVLLLTGLGFAISKGSRSATLLAIAALPPVIGGGISLYIAIQSSGYSYIGYNAFYIGAAMENILLALAVVDRVAKIRSERDEIRKENMELSHRSTTDYLTGAFNRRYVAKWIENARLKNKDYAVILFDLDFFKRINDSFGHGIGDDVLKQTVKQVSDMLRTEDILGRMGGEEFIIIQPNRDQDRAMRTAEKLRIALTSIAFPDEDETGRTHLSASFGVAIQNQKLAQSWNALEQADQALYQAKEQGRNRVYLADT